MVVNILIDNTDDHERNHALLRGAGDHWLLSRAFDVLPSARGPGVQAMQVGSAGCDSTTENALSQASALGLRQAQTKAIAREVARNVDGWKDSHFRAAGVTLVDIERLAQYIDGRHQGGERAATLGAG